MLRRRARCVKLVVLGTAATFLAVQLVSFLVSHSSEAPSPPASVRRPPRVGAIPTAPGSIFGGLGSGGKQQQQVIYHGRQNFPPAPNRSNLGKKQDSPDEPRRSQIDGLPNETTTIGITRRPRLGKKDDTEEEEEDDDSWRLSDEEIPAVLKQMSDINDRQTIRNADVFGPVTGDTVVIAIQVHNRIEYLRNLLQSLSAASHIEKALLVFSHDFWDPAVNKLVASVDFAMTMQIFYPYSIQTHPTQFPGQTDGDCPRNAKKEQADRLKCYNRDWPDLYGHYREAKVTQTKHHWWWKANRIFDQLEATRNHTGLVLFLEEDHHVAEDFLHVLKLVEKERREKHKDCDIICLGTYLKNLNFVRNGKQIGERLQPSKKPPQRSGSRGGEFAYRAVGFLGGEIALGHRSSPPQEEEEEDTAVVEDSDPPTHVAYRGRSRGGGGGTGHHRRALKWAPSSLISSVIGAFSQEYRVWAGGPAYSKKNVYVATTKWLSAKHNMGMAFNRDLWQRIHRCSLLFCLFDDYNWDWSLHHVSQSCLENPVRVMLVKAPRVFHIGECGVHHKKKECEAAADKVMKKVKDILVQVKKYLFPPYVTVSGLPGKKTKTPKGNGGWGDRRDVKLCEKMSQPLSEFGGDPASLLSSAQNVEMKRKRPLPTTIAAETPKSAVKKRRRTWAAPAYERAAAAERAVRAGFHRRKRRSENL